MSDFVRVVEDLGYIRFLGRANSVKISLIFSHLLQTHFSAVPRQVMR